MPIMIKSKKMLAALLCLAVSILLAGGAQEEKQELQLGYVAWDVHMLGVDTPEKIEAVRKSVKRTPVIALVSFSGLDAKSLFSEIEYVYGARENNGMHDTYQISEVLQIAWRMGIPLKIKVYHARNLQEIAEAFRLAGAAADIVITYSSFWSDIKPMQEAIAANPGTLYISPYVEVGERRTNTCLQGVARHPDGSGLRNFITALPLCRHRPAGELLIPSCRDRNDVETVNFIAPSSYASSMGETCPSAGVTAVTAAYVVAASPEKPDAEKIIDIMLTNTSVPEERMLALREFDAASVKRMRDSLDRLHRKDANGIRRLEADGVLDLWKICQALSEKERR